jgi:hypothetical protein
MDKASPRRCSCSWTTSASCESVYVYCSCQLVTQIETCDSFTMVRLRSRGLLCGAAPLAASVSPLNPWS